MPSKAVHLSCYVTYPNALVIRFITTASTYAGLVGALWVRQGEGLLTVQAEIGQRLLVKLALNDYWLHGQGDAIRSRLFGTQYLDQAVSLGWSPGTNGRDFQTSLDEFDQLQQIL